MSNRRDVLIVEDEAVITVVLKQTLSVHGFRVRGVAKSGKAAIAKAKQLQPDLVLMDISLQGEMDGIEAARTILAARWLPVVFMTSHSDTATVQRAWELNPAGYVIKPVRPEELIETLEAALESRDPG